MPESAALAFLHQPHGSDSAARLCTMSSDIRLITILSLCYLLALLSGGYLGATYPPFRRELICENRYDGKFGTFERGFSTETIRTFPTRSILPMD